MVSMMAGRSIRFRLTAWYTGILTATFFVAGTYVLFAVRDAAEKTVDKDLRARLSAVRQYLSAHKGERASEHLADELEEQAAIGPGGAWLQIADSTGHWIYRSSAIKDQNVEPPSGKGLRPRGRTRTVKVRGKPLRVITAAVPPNVVQIGAPMDEFAEMFENLSWALGLAIPLLLAIASAGGYWMSGRALNPVDEIAVTVRRIGGNNLGERLNLRGTGDELDRLSATMNQMLARLESAFQLVTQFTADASHELRTPVAIIRTTGEVIRARQRTSDEHEAAWDQVIVQTERMSGLIDDLLLLARADAGRSNLAFEAMDLAGALRGVADEMRILAEASGVRLATSIPATWPMTGDPDAVRRLFLVLLDNAIKYTPAGGEIKVCMSATESAEDRAVIVEVRDTGAGIASDDLPRIFDRFYRTSADRSRRTGGAGLGLAIARWLASLHGGEILVESVEGAGSTFRVIFPQTRGGNSSQGTLRNPRET